MDLIIPTIEKKKNTFEYLLDMAKQDSTFSWGKYALERSNQYIYIYFFFFYLLTLCILPSE